MNHHKTLMILLRSFAEKPSNGREKINLFIRDSLLSKTNLRIEEYHHILKTRPSLGFLLILWKIIKNCFSKSPLPWQVLLFHNTPEIRRLVGIATEFKPDTIFLEGIRSFPLLKAMRAALPSAYLVCDFDDLISRRMETWSKHEDAIAFGYMDPLIPKSIKGLFRGKIAKRLCLHEAKTLQQVELESAHLANCIVLLSAIELKAYRVQIKNKGETARLIPPACTPKNNVLTSNKKHRLRFIFIGSDALVQNRLTIEYLLQIWKTCKPNTELHIFGRMTRNYESTINVVFQGFVESLDQAYTPESILLSPSFIEGGVKTKVLEAFEHGCIVIGTSITFEGIATPSSVLTPNESLLRNYILNPEDFYDLLVAETNAILKTIQQTHSSELVAGLWRQCLLEESKLPT